MKHSEKVMPIAAALTALSVLACCLPLGIIAAVGAAGLGVILEPLRHWLLGLSVAFLAIGLLQLYRSRGTCQRRSWTNIATFCVAAAIVVGVTIFPQLLAGLLADHLP